MDRIDAMRAFLTVADLKGFAPAARKLRLSPSAVTRLVAGLENHLGARLLQRTTRSVTLTDVGMQYLERTRRIIADIDEAETSAQAQRIEPTGRLVVSAPVVFGRLHVAPLMARYLKRYPQVTAELRLNDRMVNLVEEGIDMAVRIGHLSDSSIVARTVGDMQRVVVGSPQYLKKRGRPQKLADLERHDLIRFNGAGTGVDWRFKEKGRDVRIVQPARYVTNSADAAVQYAEQGGGLAIVLFYQAEEAIRRRRLNIVLSEYEPAPIPIQIVYPSTRLLSAKVRAFIDTAIETCDWTFTKIRPPSR
ncbi:MAG: LysR family transcriptional regulator [Pseudomonadota bacterium]